ncbi:MAG: FtsX-like permease family protein [Lachnospiraceae bacterium]|nr:FtsX-like permease family protein [Lachnospiraceae bacterium]
MKSMMRKTTLREIRHSLGRYLAILAIVALGVGFFAGLRVSTSAMLQTGDAYLKEHKFFDFRLLSTLGFEQEEVDALKESEELLTAEGAVHTDVIYVGADGEEGVLSTYSIADDVNTLSIREGRLPQKAYECVLDARMQGAAIGQEIRISGNNHDDTREMFACDTYTVVGLADSPIYLNFERGSTSLLSGKVDGFMYLLPEGFDCDYYTEIYVRLPHDYAIYSEDYDRLIDEKEEIIEKLCGQAGTKRYERIVADAAQELADAEKELADKETEAREELADAKKELDDAEEEIRDAKDEIDKKERQLKSSRAQIQSGLAQIAEAKAQLQMMNVTAGPRWEALTAQETELNAGLSAASRGLKQLEDAKAEVAEHEEELADGRKEYDEASADFEKEIADANDKLADARKELDEIEKPDCYTLSRKTNVGYVCFENDVEIVNGVSLVFPVFFFLVAALVCMTTMNRMIEEQRTQIGVLKALGYGKAAIMGKYMFYSGSAALIGGIGGFFLGSYVFPIVLWETYQLMYGFSDTIAFVFDLPLFLISLAVALLCSVGATYFSCCYELGSVTAELIRPKAPKNGKRILLERVGWFWNRLKFLHKVSIRNVVRYKKRFFMMILGISGCSALLVTGFGIKDSMKNLMTKQYGGIELYDVNVTFDDAFDEGDLEEFEGTIRDFADKYLLLNEESVDIETGGVTRNVTLIVPKQEQELSDFISLHTVKGEPIAFPQAGEIVITMKAADKLGVRAGDTVTLFDSDRRHTELLVSAIAENYIYNYAFINEESYTEGLKKEIAYTGCRVNLKDREAFDADNAVISDLDFVLSSSANRTFQERFYGMLSNMDYIVLLVIVSAGALAFIVLYNLTNINITERIREIATIKVLGFYPGETASYVFRENTVLTVLGGLLGLFLGKLLHQYVMFNIDLDAVAFETYIAGKSYAYSIALTFVFAMFVNGMMYFKLKKINMAESLKSME